MSVMYEGLAPLQPGADRRAVPKKTHTLKSIIIIILLLLFMVEIKVLFGM